jgi:hypothetical protein
MLGSLSGTSVTIDAIIDGVTATFRDTGVFSRVLFHRYVVRVASPSAGNECRFLQWGIRSGGDDVGLAEAYGRFSGIPTCEGHK